MSLVEAGKKAYDRIYPELIDKYRDKFIAVEPDSELFWIGDTLMDALQKAKARFPDKQFYLHQIGREGVASFK